MDAEASSARSLRGVLEVGRRRWWLIALTATIAGAVAFALASARPARYEAESEVLVRRQDVAALLGASSGSGPNEPADRYLQTQADLARVPELAERVVEAAGPPGYTAADLLGSSSVVPRTNADFLEFRVADQDPAVAIRLAAEYAEQFTSYESELTITALADLRTDLESRIAELERSGGRATPLYTSLTERVQQVRILEALQTTSAFAVRPATDASKVAPTPRRDAVLGVLAGLLLGIGVVVLMETLDTSLRTAGAVTRQLRMPLLGRIPAPSRRHRRPGQIAMLRSPNSPEAEAFRLLRGSFEFANAEPRRRVVMVTSAVEGEGKTTTAANLAVAIARAGTDVVIVDGDLRSPSVHLCFDLPRSPGLTDVVSGSVSLDDALVAVPTLRADAGAEATERGTLSVLPAGPAAKSVGELIMTPGFSRVFTELRSRKVLVIVDSSPFLVAGDALALTAHVDAVLLVARLGHIQRAQAAEVRRLLERSGAEPMGVVLTGMDSDTAYEDLGEYGDSHPPSGPQEHGPNGIRSEALVDEPRKRPYVI